MPSMRLRSRRGLTPRAAWVSSRAPPRSLSIQPSQPLVLYVYTVAVSSRTECFVPIGVLLFFIATMVIAMSGMSQSSESPPKIYSFLRHIVPFIASHPDPDWTMDDHYGFCGQSCECCRAANEEDWLGTCDICLDAWCLTTLSRRFLEFMLDHGSAQPRNCYVRQPKRIRLHPEPSRMYLDDQSPSNSNWSSVGWGWYDYEPTDNWSWNWSHWRRDSWSWSTAPQTCEVQRWHALDWQSYGDERQS